MANHIQRTNLVGRFPPLLLISTVLLVPLPIHHRRFKIDSRKIKQKALSLPLSMLDFAPLYSGVIMGVSNTVANFTGILAPLTTGLLLDAGKTLEQWRAAFWISAAIYVSGWVAFQVGYNYNQYRF